MKTAGAGWIRLIRAGEKGNRCKSLRTRTVSREYQKRKKSLDNGRPTSDVWICESGDLPVAYMEVNPDHGDWLYKNGGKL